MSSGLLTAGKIAAAGNCDWPTLLEFDRQGLFPAPGESAEEFAARLTRLAEAADDLSHKLQTHKIYEIVPGIKLENALQIPQSLRSEALNLTCSLYGVKPQWVPGFFADESFGALWGGCALSDGDSGLVLFIIRKLFTRKRRWLFYDRRELMAHEMTHASHQSLNEWQLEEYFAYRTARSPLRRFFGGCFICKYDAAGFLGPILLLPLVQLLNLFGIVSLPMIFFWILAAVYPGYLLWRCSLIWHRVNKARKFLISQKVKQPDAVLFRLTYEEVKALGRGIWFNSNDLRTGIIRRRFFSSNISGKD